MPGMGSGWFAVSISRIEPIEIMYDAPLCNWVDRVIK
jgi:hypothetical protein